MSITYAVKTIIATVILAVTTTATITATTLYCIVNRQTVLCFVHLQRFECNLQSFSLKIITIQIAVYFYFILFYYFSKLKAIFYQQITKYKILTNKLYLINLCQDFSKFLHPPSTYVFLVKKNYFFSHFVQGGEGQVTLKKM